MDKLAIRRRGSARKSQVACSMSETLEQRCMLSIMVKDITPVGSSSPEDLVNVDGTLFFSADDGIHNRELWKSDGTAAGTVMVKDINPASWSIYSATLTNCNHTLFLAARNGTYGAELWRSDGTAAGTYMIKDINPAGDSFPQKLTDVNGTLFFTADDGVHGNELWKSDGTPTGTVMVKDISPDPKNSGPLALISAGGKLFFTADDGIHGRELWRSDGTPAGTAMVKDLQPGGGSSGPVWLADLNGTVFFEANDGLSDYQLWKSDGTAAGTVRVDPINPMNAVGASQLTNVNGTLFYTGWDPAHGQELWMTDGTAAGTTMVNDINPTGDSKPQQLVNVDGVLFFEATDGVNGRELWTTRRLLFPHPMVLTSMVKDIRPGAAGSALADLTDVNGTLYFGADDGVHGSELWMSNGTAAGTVMVKDIEPGAFFSAPGRFTPIGSTVYFSAKSAGYELWRLDVPTIRIPAAFKGRPLLVSLSPGDSEPAALTSWYISWGDGHSDTVPATTSLVTHVYAAAGTYKIISNYSAANGVYSFAAKSVTVYETPASVKGAVYNDVNGNAKRENGEARIAKRRVFIDMDKDGIWDANEPSTLTDSKGRFAFNNLVPIDYRLVVLPPKGWRASSYRDVSLAGKSVLVKQDLGLTRMALVCGTVFGDVNRNKLIDGNETGLRNWWAYVDSNGNKRLDKGESKSATDALGNFAIRVAPGKYTVRIARKAGYKPTTPKGASFKLKLTRGKTKAGLVFGYGK